MNNYNDVLIDPSEVVICLIDYQSQMFFGLEGFYRDQILNSVAGLARTAKVFKIPIVLSTTETNSFSGPLYSEIQDIFPEIKLIKRTALNAWEDENFKNKVESYNRKKLILAGLWMEICVTLPALSASYDGYKIYVVIDACAGASKSAISRITQAGAELLTWQELLLEIQRDWAKKETYDEVMEIIKEHGGTYGVGVEFMKPKRFLKKVGRIINDRILKCKLADYIQ